MPPLDVQPNDSGLGPASLSCADDVRAIEPPTWTSAGFAPSASIVGQMLSLPLTSTLPVRASSLQVIGTMADEILPASTSNEAAPLQLVIPSVVVALSES